MSDRTEQLFNDDLPSLGNLLSGDLEKEEFINAMKNIGKSRYHEDFDQVKQKPANLMNEDATTKAYDRTLVRIKELENLKENTLTLRDQFAMSALAGMTIGTSSGYNYDYAADSAYKIADAMLERRKK